MANAFLYINAIFKEYDVKKISKAASVPAILAALLLVALAAGCAPKAAPSAVDSIKKAGKLVIGTSADFPPYEFHLQQDGADTVVGFDVSIAKEIAKDLGVQLEIKDMKFDGLLAALDSGNVDIVIAGMTPTEERKKSTDFSDIYYRAEQGVIVRAEDASKYNSITALSKAMIGAQKGAIQVGIAKTQIKGMADANADNAEVKELGKVADLVLELKSKKIDAIVVETEVAKAYVAANPDLAVAPFVFPDSEGGAAVAVKKGNAVLVEAVNKTLARLETEGSVASFVTKAKSDMDKL
jgi:polar amino acid transport system substrate-binding protein